jgi:hypothetical protein
MKLSTSFILRSILWPEDGSPSHRTRNLQQIPAAAWARTAAFTMVEIAPSLG